MAPDRRRQPRRGGPSALRGSHPPAASGLNGYVDASALVAVLLREPSSAEIEALLLGCARLASSRLTYVEARSAVAAARRAGRLSRRSAAAARRELEQRWDEIGIVELVEPIARAAGAAAERHGLMSHDAVQLATALALADGNLAMVTLDERLLRAARASGLATAPTA